MNTTSRPIFAALLGLSALWGITPRVRADDAADAMAEWRRQNDEFNRQAYEEREARDRWNREQQEQREAMDRFNREAQEARDAMDKFNRETQQQSDAFYQWNSEVQKWRDDQQKQQEWDDWLNRLNGSAQAGYPSSGAGSTTPKTAQPRPAPIPQVRHFAPVVPPRRVVPQNAIAFQQMVREHQARVRQQILQSRQQMLPGRQESGLLTIHNPFVDPSH